MARDRISKEFWQFEHEKFVTGALAAGGAIIKTTIIDELRGQGWRGSKIKYIVEWGGKTTAQGPIWWGLSWNLTAAQVGAGLSPDPQNDVENDMVDVLQNMIVIGQIPKDSTKSGELAGTTRYLRDQPFSRMNIPSWDVVNGTALSFWQGVPLVGVNVDTGMELEISIGYKGGWLSA